MRLKKIILSSNNCEKMSYLFDNHIKIDNAYY
jgi:hypothetical protein